MGENTFYGESLKEIYREDIEDSRKQLISHKLFEFFDDYTYGTSKNMGIFIYKEEDNTNLVLFMEKGPDSEEIMRKLLEWRRSGSSEEIGHKGGGNKRNIYGHHSNEIYLMSKINKDKVIYAITRPDTIYNLAISEISESDFRAKVDRSECVVSPCTEKLKNLPAWYELLHTKIKTESSVTPDYIIKMSLTESPIEYTRETKWNELINQIRAKQYNIPIYFKNELIGEKEYKKYTNLDLLGITIDKKECETDFDVFCTNDCDKFYIKNNDGKFCDVVSHEKEDSETNLKKWGKIKTFIADKDIIKKNCQEYNAAFKNNSEGKLTADALFGIYLLINEKITNYLPFVGIKNLSDARNTKFKRSSGTISNGCSYFRMILYPDIETCTDRKLFDKLIKTESIKAQTNFVSSSPYEEIIRYILDELRGNNKKKPKPAPNPSHGKPKKEKGLVYLIYLGKKLYKFGMVSKKSNYKNRLKQHRKESIEKIEEFLGEQTVVENAITYWTCDTDTPKGYEEKIKLSLLKYNNSEVSMFDSGSDDNDFREYFVCENDDFILQTFIPEIGEIRV